MPLHFILVLYLDTLLFYVCHWWTSFSWPFHSAIKQFVRSGFFTWFLESDWPCLLMFFCSIIQLNSNWTCNPLFRRHHPLSKSTTSPSFGASQPESRPPTGTPSNHPPRRPLDRTGEHSVDKGNDIVALTHSSPLHSLWARTNSSSTAKERRFD